MRLRASLLTLLTILVVAALSLPIADGWAPSVSAQQPPITPVIPTPRIPILPTPHPPVPIPKGIGVDIPAVARKAVPDKDFVEVFCLTSRWQLERFSASMDVTGEAMTELKAKVGSIGVQLTVPDTAALKTEGKAKVDAICAAATLEAAQSALTDFLGFGNSVQDRFQGMVRELNAKFQEFGVRVQAKVEADARAYGDQEKTRLQQEIQDSVNTIVKQALSNIGPTSDPKAIQKNIENQINVIVQGKVQDLSKRIEARVLAIVEQEIKPIREIETLMINAGARIEKVMTTDTPQGAAFKRQAITKRKEMLARIADANMAQAKEQLEKARADLDAAKKLDPSVKSVDEILAEITRDRATMEQKIDAVLNADALAVDADVRVQAAINEFVNKWAAMASNADKQRMSAVRLREMARPQLVTARAQIAQGVQGLDQVMEQLNRLRQTPGQGGPVPAPGGVVPAPVSTGDLTPLRERMSALITRIDAAIAALDKATADTPVQPIMDMLSAIQREQEALQQLVAGLKAKDAGKESILIQAEDEVAASVAKPGTNWDSTEEIKPSWRKGWTGAGDWYLSRGGDRLTYSFKIQNPAAFQVWVRDWDDGKHPVGSGAIDMLFTWNGGSAELRNAPENSVRNSQHQWHKVGQVTLNAQPGAAISLSVVKSSSTSKAAVLDAYFLTSDPNQAPPDVPPPPAPKTTENFLIQAENEVDKTLYPQGTTWDSTKEKSPSWRKGWTGTGDWYLSRAGESLVYEFTTKADGAFSLWVRDLDDGKHQAGARTITVVIDQFQTGGQVLGDFPENTVRNNEFQWHKVKDGIQLKASKHTMTVYKKTTTSAAATLDAFFLTSDPNVQP
ncbi:MAG: hypothetical protein Q7T26_12110 [Dehalococcoidia bacterium]|nr:hypothetical protein [Dehalococcoidia bacterium]